MPVSLASDEKLASRVEREDAVKLFLGSSMSSDGIRTNPFDFSDDFESRSLRVCIVDNDFGATAAELDGHCSTNSTAGTRYERDLAIETVGIMRGA